MKARKEKVITKKRVKAVCRTCKYESYFTYEKPWGVVHEVYECFHPKVRIRKKDYVTGERVLQEILCKDKNKNGNCCLYHYQKDDE
jgi:hypothetical protein